MRSRDNWLRQTGRRLTERELQQRLVLLRRRQQQQVEREALYLERHLG